MPADPLAAQTIHTIIDAARAQLDDEIWDYIAGAAETETTARRNRLAIDSLALRPRVLRDVSNVDARTTLLGQPMRIPVLLGPLGALEVITPEGGLASARAAERFGTLAAISSVAEPGFAAVAAATAGPKISQLYIRGDERWADELVDSVVEAGYLAIALTVDAPIYGRRERQIRHGWVPPEHRRADNARIWQARLTWEWLDRLRERTTLPFILKGIATAQDAELALEHGVEAIYISNHGGRDLDQGQATIETLREIVDAVGGGATVIVDGGFMRGTDVLKGIALGADAVGIGRLQAFALAAGGADALVRALELLEEEIATTMGLLGVRSLAELDPSFVSRAQPLAAPSALLAAFPDAYADWRPLP
jgi:isopentenyl diphosphate isomerase/L-lactate dehydrogenase-like FMN-dependent dehydrogenase